MFQSNFEMTFLFTSFLVLDAGGLGVEGVPPRVNA